MTLRIESLERERRPKESTKTVEMTRKEARRDSKPHILILKIVLAPM